MLDGRLIYQMCKKMSEKGIGAKSKSSVFSGLEEFYISSINAGGELYSEYRLFTKYFALESSMTISLGDLEGLSGEWTKEFNACEISEEASVKYKKSIGEKKIEEWINNFIIKKL